MSTHKKQFMLSCCLITYSKIHMCICTFIGTGISILVFNHVCCVYVTLYVSNMYKLQIVLLSAILNTTTWGMCSLMSRVLQLSS